MQAVFASDASSWHRSLCHSLVQQQRYAAPVNSILTDSVYGPYGPLENMDEVQLLFSM